MKPRKSSGCLFLLLAIIALAVVASIARQALQTTNRQTNNSSNRSSPTKQPSSAEARRTPRDRENATQSDRGQSDKPVDPGPQRTSLSPKLKKDAEEFVRKRVARVQPGNLVEDWPELASFFADTGIPAAMVVVLGEGEGAKVARLQDEAQTCVDWLKSPTQLVEKTQSLLSEVFAVFRKGSLSLGQATDASILVLQEAQRTVAASQERLRILALELQRLVLPHLLKKAQDLRELTRKTPGDQDLALLRQAIEDRLNRAAFVKGLIEAKLDVLEKRRLGIEALVETLRLEKDTLGEADRNPVVLPRAAENFVKGFE